MQGFHEAFRGDPQKWRMSLDILPANETDFPIQCLLHLDII